MSNYKLYTDGSCLEKHGLAGFGGYILNPEGQRVIEFSDLVPDPKYHTLHELIGFTYGLNKCLELGITNIECFIDAKNVSDIANVKAPDKRKNLISRLSIIQDLFDNIDKFEGITVTHIYRKENTEADKLSHVAINQVLKQRQTAQINSFLPNGNIERDNISRIGLMELIKDKTNRLKPIIPNIYFNGLFSPKNIDYFEGLKKHTKIYLMFNLSIYGEKYKLIANTIEKVNGAFTILSSEETIIPTKGWQKSYLKLVNASLEKNDKKQIGLIFTNLNDNKMMNLFKGTQGMNISPYGEEIKALKETTEKFDAIMLNYTKAILRFVNEYNAQAKRKSATIDNVTTEPIVIKPIPVEIKPIAVNIEPIQLTLDFQAPVTEPSSPGRFSAFLQLGKSMVQQPSKTIAFISQKIQNFRKNFSENKAKFRL